MTESPGLNPAELRLLAELGGLLATGSSEGEVLEALFSGTEELIPVNRISVARYFPGESQSAQTWESGVHVASNATASQAPEEGSLAAFIFKTGNGFMETGVDSELLERFPLFGPTIEAGFKSIIAVPLRSPEAMFGILHLQSLTPGQYDERHLSIAEAIGVHLGSALTSIGLRDDLSRELKEHSAIADIVQIVNGASEIEAVYDRFAKAVGELVPTERIVISIIADDEESHYDAYIAGTSIPDFGRNASHPMESSPTELMIKIRNAVQIDLDAFSTGDSVPEWVTATKSASLTSVIAAPLIQDGKVFGSVQVRSSIDRPYAENEIRLVGEVAAQISGAIANSRLRAHLKREIAESEVLARNGVSVSSASSVTEIGDAVVENLADLLQFDHIGIGSLNDGGVTFKVEYQYPKLTHSADLIGKSFPLAGSATGAVAQSRSTLVLGGDDFEAQVSDIPTFTANLPKPMRSGVAVPLLSNGVIVGGFIVGRETGSDFSADEIHTIERVSGGISGPVANAILRRKLAQDANQQRVLAEISRVAGDATSISDIGEALVRAVPEILPFKYLAISRIDSDSRTYWTEFFHGLPDRPEFKIGLVQDLPGSMAGSILESRQAVALDLTDAKVLGDYPTIRPAVEIGMTSTVGVPLISNGVVIGALLIGNDEGDPYTDADATVAERVADQIAGAIGNLRLQQELQEQSSRRQALADIGRAAITSATMEEMGERIIQRLSGLVGITRLAFGVASGDTQTYEYLYSSPDLDGSVGRQDPLEGSLIAEVLDSREAQAFDKSNIEELFKKFPQFESIIAWGINRGILLPLVANDQVIGMMLTGDEIDDDYPASDAEFMQRVADQIAGAIANVSLRDDLEEVASERKILAEIGRVASEAQTFDALGSNTMPLIGQLVPAPRLELRTISPDHKDFERVFILADEDLSVETLGRTGKLEGSVSGMALEQRSPVAIGPDDCAENLPAALRSRIAGYYAGVHVPLISNDEVVGFLVVDKTEERDYQPGEIDLLEQIGQQIAGPMASLVLRQQLERESTERQALAEIGQAVSRSLDFEVIGDTIYGHLSRLMGVSRLIMTIVSDDGQTAAIIYANVPTTIGGSSIAELEGSFTGRTIADGELQMFGSSNVAETLAQSPQLKNAIHGWGFSRAISVPLITRNKVIGTLMFGDGVDDDYSDADGHFAQRVADQISGAIAIALQRRTEQREADIQELLNRVSTAATGGLEPSLLFNQIEAELRTEFEYDRFEALLADSDGETLRFACINGIAIGDLEQGDLVPTGVQTLRSWGPILEGSATDSPKHDHIIDSGLNSWVQVPIGFPSDSPIGFIGIRALTTDAYTEDDARTLARIAAQITPALQNARTHQQSIELAAERERSIELETQASELQRISEEKSQFLETVTHELKTPLTSIQAFTDLLLRNREGNLTDRQIRNLGVSSRNARRLGLLIDDLVDVSQIQRGSFELHQTEFDLVDLTNDMVESMQPILEDKDQELKYQLNSSTIWLKADHARIAQVITNLLSNASKYSPNGSSIVFCVDVEHTSVLLEVQDDGSGISEADMSQLFTPLFRADNEETRAVPGTGIGLAIVKQIVDMHGGEINVTSQLGVGSMFKVSFPRQVSEPSAEYLAEQRDLADKSTPRSRFSELPPE